MANVGLLRFQRGDLRSQQRDLVVHILDGVFEAESQAARLAFDAADLRLRGDQIGLRGVDGGLGDVDLHLVRLLVELHQQVALVDAIVVIDQNAHDLPGTRGATNVTWPFT